MTGRESGARSWLKLSGLTYALFVFSVPVLSQSAWPIWAATAGSFVLFAFLYLDFFKQHAKSRQRAATGLVAMALLGFVIVPFNIAAATYIVYAAALAPFVFRPGLSIAAMTGLAAGIAIELSLLTGPDRLVIGGWLVFLILVVGGGNLFVGDRAHQKALIRQAREDVEELAKLAERERIARDLHDLLGHTLSLIVVKSELAARLAESDSTRAGVEMRDVERIGREALAEVRAAVVGYRAKGLRGELDGARRALDAAGVKATVVADLPALPIAYESALALALRESVTNVVRHAGARHATIRIGVEGSSIVLEVTADGKGSSGPEGAGLTGMRERITALGGAVQRDGGQGMRVRVSLPVEATTGIAGARPSESSGRP